MLTRQRDDAIELAAEDEGEGGEIDQEHRGKETGKADIGRGEGGEVGEEIRIDAGEEEPYQHGEDDAGHQIAELHASGWQDQMGEKETDDEDDDGERIGVAVLRQTVSTVERYANAVDAAHGTPHREDG